MRKKFLVIGAIAGSAMLVGGWALAASDGHGPARGAMQHEGHGKALHKGHGMAHHQRYKTATGPKREASDTTRGSAAASQQHKH